MSRSDIVDRLLTRKGIVVLIVLVILGLVAAGTGFFDGFSGLP